MRPYASQIADWADKLKEWSGKVVSAIRVRAATGAARSVLFARGIAYPSVEIQSRK